MSKTDLLFIQAEFVFRLKTISAFLGTAMDFITAANHKLTDEEKTGFHYCIKELKRNARGVIEADKRIQEMEAANG